jgi:uncharacterized membrane protein
MSIGILARTALPTVLWIAAAVAPQSARAESFEVTDVAAEDVLNLRAEPRAGAPLTVALSPTAGGIEIERRSDGWAYVRAGRQSGWAAERYLRPALQFEAGKPPLPQKCGGTEPFWSLTLDDRRATYQTPEVKATGADIGPFEPSRNSTIVWRVQPKDGPVASATIEARQACSDNMSDRIYPFSVRVETRNGELLSGCCDTGR